MKIKVSELQGPALDWAVAMCRGFEGLDEDEWLIRDGIADMPLSAYTPSTDWAQGGPIIEREGIGFFCNRTANVGARFKPDAGADWRACPYNKLMDHHFGPTPLIAAMRCYVTSKLGGCVEVPNELFNE